MTNQDYWEDDGFSIVGNPGTASPDIINFGAGAQDTLSLYGASSSDTISLGEREFNTVSLSLFFLSLGTKFVTFELSIIFFLS